MTEPLTSRVEDSVPKVDDEVAVGENLAFQRRWWVFERVVWAFFLLVIVCDLAGLFGDGWLAKAHASTADGSLTLAYDRIERANTPSTMFMRFGQSAIRDGRIEVFVSDSVVKELGAERIAPQPMISSIGEGGITYSFPATAAPAQVEIQLQPATPGPHRFRIRMAGQPPIVRSIFVMP